MGDSWYKGVGGRLEGRLGGICIYVEASASVTSPYHQLSAPNTLWCTKAGALRHRSSLPYERASDQGLELELELPHHEKKGVFLAG